MLNSYFQLLSGSYKPCLPRLTLPHQKQHRKAVAAGSYFFCMSSALCHHPPSLSSLTNTLSHSIMASNRVKADGAAGPAQQTAVEWIYIQSLHFILLLLLLLWSLMNSRESMEPINVRWSTEAPSLDCMDCFLRECPYVDIFYLHVFLAVNEVQWFSGGLVRTRMH